MYHKSNHSTGPRNFFGAVLLRSMCRQGQPGEVRDIRHLEGWVFWGVIFVLFLPCSGDKFLGAVHGAILILSCVCSVTKSCLALGDPMDCNPAGSSVHGVFPGKNTGVGCHFLLQRIFPTRGSNPGLPCLLCWQTDHLPLSHLGSPINSFTRWQMCTQLVKISLWLFSSMHGWCGGWGSNGGYCQWTTYQ